MPLTVNVGLSRKTSANYQSEGVSLNLCAELDHALLANPDRLLQEIAGLYRQADAALDRRLPAPAGSDSPRSANPDRSGSRRDADDRPITCSHLRALGVMADKRKLNLDAVAEREFGVAAADLSIEEASRLIDLLKAKPVPERASSNGNGVHR